MKIVAKRYDAISYRLMDGEDIVGFALQLANGSWGMYRPDCETRIGRNSYLTPKDVAIHFQQLSI